MLGVTWGFSADTVVVSVMGVHPGVEELEPWPSPPGVELEHVDEDDIELLEDG